MNYSETVEYILSIPLFAQKIGTENLASLLERLGNPQDKSKVIHIAGTNGKGSTAKALATILMHAGFHVGLFTSPHLVSINERIRYDDEMISDEDFTWAFDATIEGNADIKNYADYLFEHAGGAILSWVIEGSKKVIKDNYKITPPQKVCDAIEHYRDSNDWLSYFLSERCEIDSSCIAKSGENYILCEKK